VTIQFEAILKEELFGLVFVGDILVSESSLVEAGTSGMRSGNRLLMSGQKRTFRRDYGSDADALNAKHNAQAMII
jgi:hypothetical protein